MTKPRLQPKKGDLIFWPKDPDFLHDEDLYYLILEDAVRQSDGFDAMASTAYEVEVWRIYFLNSRGEMGHNFLYDKDHWINLSNPLDKSPADD